MPHSKTLVIQSFRTVDVPEWISACLASVKTWVDMRGYGYRFVGDEIFDRVPSWYLEKASKHPQIATDLGRLELIHEALNEGYSRVAWLDADVLIFDPDGFDVKHIHDFAFGLEFWVQSDQRGQLKL